MLTMDDSSVTADRTNKWGIDYPNQIGTTEFGLDTCRRCLVGQHQMCKGDRHRNDRDIAGCACSVCHGRRYTSRQAQWIPTDLNNKAKWQKNGGKRTSSPQRRTAVRASKRTLSTDLLAEKRAAWRQVADPTQWTEASFEWMRKQQADGWTWAQLDTITQRRHTRIMYNKHSHGHTFTKLREAEVWS